MALYHQYMHLSRQVADDSQTTLDEVTSKELKSTVAKTNIKVVDNEMEVEEEDQENQDPQQRRVLAASTMT